MSEPVDPKRVRDIKIKSGVVKRLAKEKVNYEKEVEKQQAKMDSIRLADPDDYALKKEEEILDESRKMIPDCERRLISAWDELSKLMVTEQDLQDTAEYKAALEILEEARVAAKR